MTEATPSDESAAASLITVDRAIMVVAAAGGLFFLVFGIWAFADPSSFYDNFALFPPYNRHLLHDVGAFQIGIGATLLIALPVRDSLATALGGAGIGSAVHTVSHVIDHELGGGSSDTVTFGIISAVLLAAAAWRYLRRGVTHPNVG